MKSLRGLPSPFRETPERDFPSLFLALFGVLFVSLFSAEICIGDDLDILKTESVLFSCFFNYFFSPSPPNKLLRFAKFLPLIALFFSLFFLDLKLLRKSYKTFCSVGNQKVNNEKYEVDMIKAPFVNGVHINHL
jgi:hypothetical protein